jgi:beta-galactosidase
MLIIHHDLILADCYAKFQTMYQRCLSLIVALICSCLLLAQKQENNRVSILFNFDWKFQNGDVANATSAALDDRDWRKLDLPHDFQIEDKWDSAANRGRGFKALSMGWYRKTFKADPAWKGKRVLIDFEGIMLHGDVWLNGKKIGGTDYGYLGFEADIESLLKYDADNLVAVRATTEGASRWYTGGGLFRDVHLVLKDSISIARHGVFITTPKIAEKEAEVNVQVELEGIRGKQYNVEIQTKVFAPNGQQVGTTKTWAPQKTNLNTVEVPLPKLTIAQPQLWSCETPHLYTAEVALLFNGKIIDQVTEKFGIRTIEFSKEFGLKLNGKKVFLKGVANHHDLGAVGAAAHETSIARMMDRIKAFGFNHIRTSHNPYSESFFKLADEKGLLIVNELYDKWGSSTAWSGSAPWNDLWFNNIKEWIKRDRNHPSVIMWSFGNELQFQEERWGFATGDWGVTTYRLMDVVAKRYDPSRKTTVAMYPARAGGIIKKDPDFKVPANIVPPELATVTDVASFNYVWDDYQTYLKHAPNMIIYQSEAVTNELAAPFFGMDRDKMVGLAYWGAIEYWGESDGWPKKGWNYSFFNHALEPFPQAWLTKSIFTDAPLVQIGVVDNEGDSKLWNDVIVGQKVISAHWNRQEGKKYNLYTYTNADEVELFINGKSMGIQQNSSDVRKRNTIYWKDIPYSSGKILAIARKAGKEVARHELATTGPAVGLTIETENPNWKANGMDLQYVKVYAIDNKGRKVPTVNAEVSFDVSGPANLIAVDNGNHTSNDLFASNKKALHNGFAMAILRAQQKPGSIKLIVTAPGLKMAEQILIVK